MINRNHYLDQLIKKRDNGLIKVITGIRRCGKSYLLFEIYKNYLISNGVDEKYIIGIALDETPNAKYRNPFILDEYIRDQIVDNDKMYYIFIDEIQLVSRIQNPYVDSPDALVGFSDVLLGLMKIKNADIYVTGSNSKMLSSDILTEFKDRGDEIKVYPLSFGEFYEAFEGDKHRAWREYFTYGGMPLVMTKSSHEEKSKYLKDLFTKTYITDVIERNHLTHDTLVLDDLLNVVSSAVGSLTNPTKLSKTFKTVDGKQIAPSTISKYLDCFIDAFILSKAERYDVKGKRYIGSPLKYYFADVGLRNARLNFRQQEENHIMENIIYNELVFRGFDVDVGVVEVNKKDENGKSMRIQYEVDFVTNKVSKRYYIQSAFSIESDEKRVQETKSLDSIPDSYKKIVVVRDDIIPWHDEKGILYIGVEQFLLEKEAIDL